MQHFSIKQWCAYIVLCLLMSWPALSQAETGYTFSTKQLQAVVSKKFPVDMQFTSLIKAILLNPVVDLDEVQQRVILTMDFQLQGNLLPNKSSGIVTVAAGLKYDNKEQALVLVQPTLLKIQSMQHNPIFSASEQYILNRILVTLFDHYPIYTLKDKKLKLLGVAYHPTSIQIKKNGIYVEFSMVS